MSGVAGHAPSLEHVKPLSPPALQPLSFSTRDLPAASQLAAWQALMEPLVAISLPAGLVPADGFPADHTAWNLGGMLVVQQSVPAHGYIRSAEKIRSSSIDHWCLVVLRNGRTWTEVDGRVAEGRPGASNSGRLATLFAGGVPIVKVFAFICQGIGLLAFPQLWMRETTPFSPGISQIS